LIARRTWSNGLGRGCNPPSLSSRVTKKRGDPSATGTATRSRCSWTRRSNRNSRDGHRQFRAGLYRGRAVDPVAVRLARSSDRPWHGGFRSQISPGCTRCRAFDLFRYRNPVAPSTAAGGPRHEGRPRTMFVAIGTMVVFGLDRTIETAIVDASPRWLIDLSTRF
jgi:hypothetical protein